MTELQQLRERLATMERWVRRAIKLGVALLVVAGTPRGIWDINDGTPALHLLDSRMKSRLVLGMTELKDVAAGTIQRRTESSILLFGEDGKVIFSAP